MDFYTLLTGAIGGFLANLIINYFSKNLDYKYDYKKYILKKRQIAYDEIESILIQMSEKQTFYPNEIKIHKFFFFPAYDLIFTEFKQGLNRAIAKNSVWLSNEVITVLVDINAILVALFFEHPAFEQYDIKDKVDLAKKYYDPLENERKKLYDIFFTDIKKLDDIGHFKKNKVNF